MKRGHLIAFEGVDGCGKSTQLSRVAQALRAAGHTVVETHEPTDGPVGRRIRAMARSGERVDPAEELAWFLEDRREHVDRVIQPGLSAGRVVLTDRYTLSSVAYQGARGLDWREILARSESEFPLPDLALLFEIAPRIGMQRVRARGGIAEPAFEEIAFQERVAAIFGSLDRSYIARVAATGDIETITGRALTCIGERLGVELNPTTAPHAPSGDSEGGPT